METARNRVVDTVRTALPVASRAFKDPSLEVRRLGVEALEQATETLHNLVRNPRFYRPAMEETTNQEQLESEWTALLPLMEALKARGPLLCQALLDPDRKIRLLAGQALEGLAASRHQLSQRAASAGITLAALGQHRSHKPAVGEEVQTVAYPPPAPETETDPLLDGLRTTFPALMVEVYDPDVRARRRAIDVLETLGPEAAPAAPALVRALEDPDRFMRWAAARTLRKIGPVEPATAVPALERLLNDRDLDVCLAAVATLQRYGPAAKSALPSLTRALIDQEPELRLAALRALRSMGPEACPAIPAVKDARTDADARVRQLAEEVLRKLESAGSAPRKYSPDGNDPHTSPKR
jgi:HEAT repeat protein